MTFSSYGTSRYFSGEGDQVIVPRSWRNDGSLRAVIYCHGSNRSAADIKARGEPNVSNLVEALGAVYPTVACDLGGNTPWGNATHVSRIGSAVTYMQSTWGAKSGAVLLVGTSMGVLGAWNYRRNNPSLVQAIAGIIPVCNLTEIYTTTAATAMQDAISAAWGVTRPAALSGTADPNTNRSELTGVRASIWYGASDTLCLPASATAFATGIGATATQVAGTHGDSTVGNVSTADVLSFLAAS